MPLKNTIIISLFIFLMSCKENISFSDKDITQTTDKLFNFYPTSTTNAVYEHNFYSFSYSEAYEQAEWVAYYLSPEDIKNVHYKRPYFEEDDLVITGSAHWRNYKKSGYNKGHLCPAADRKKSYKSYEETFLTSNISPQKYNFNAGVWNRLEQKVRYWAKKYDGLYVITAGVLTPDLKTIGYENVAVPNYFYKVLLTKDKQRMIAFLVPHKKSDAPLYTFAISVDELEEKTGIDFFPELEDEIELKLEKNNNYKKWSF